MPMKSRQNFSVVARKWWSLRMTTLCENINSQMVVTKPVAPRICELLQGARKLKHHSRISYQGFDKGMPGAGLFGAAPGAAAAALAGERPAADAGLSFSWYVTTGDGCWSSVEGVQ